MNRMTLIYILTILLMFYSLLLGGAEYVTVIKVLDDNDKGIVERANGEQWLIEKYSGALSFWKYEGKKVIINSQGMFCGVGSTLILPEDEQQARIWNAEQIDSTGTVKSVPISSGSVKTIASPNQPSQSLLQAFVMLNYKIGQNNISQNLIVAINEFQKKYKINEKGFAGPMTKVKLSELLLKNHGNDPQALDLVLILVAEARKATNQKNATITQSTTSPSKATETYVSFVSSSGEIVKLANGNIYKISTIDQIKTMLWLPVQNVMVQTGRLINLSNGDSVEAILMSE